MPAETELIGVVTGPGEGDAGGLEGPEVGEADAEVVGVCGVELGVGLPECLGFLCFVPDQYLSPGSCPWGNFRWSPAWVETSRAVGDADAVDVTSFAHAYAVAAIARKIAAAAANLAFVLRRRALLPIDVAALSRAAVGQPAAASP